MTNICYKIKYVAFVMMLALLFVCPVSAAQGGHQGGGHQGGAYQSRGFQGRGFQGRGFQGRGFQGRGYRGSYYGGYHGSYYHGYHGSYGYRYGHYGYWYGGWWFPWVGIIPYLPFYYQTIWIGGYPYYYADGDYYAPTDNGYMVVNPQPQGQGQAQSQAVSPQTGQQTEQQTTMEPSTKLFIYPRNGQSEKQQAEDRSACDHWAVGQTGYDSAKPADGTSFQKNADYQRAMAACLDARGYSTK
ncbi:MAG: hypothetical protein WB290_00865 [Smithella sp.]